uniref:Uncharacterized protein n=1 Tax=Anguilla anguilla TaxID=7936 RepID=A0A0E9QG59_ANGAN
MAGRQSFTVY